VTTQDPVIAVVLSHIAQKLARANSTDRKVVVNVAAEIADKLEPKSGERDPVSRHLACKCK
jgi:hypothetical protein